LSMLYFRGLKLKVAHRPFEPQSKVSRAALKNEIVLNELKINESKKILICLIYFEKSKFY